LKEVGRQVLRCQTRRPVAPAQPRAAGQFPTTDACSRELSFVCFPVSDPPNPPPEPSMEARVGPGPTQKRLQIPFLQSLRRCLPGSGRSGVAASPHAPFIQPVRLIGRILSPPSPDPPPWASAESQGRLCPDPKHNQNNVPTRPSPGKRAWGGRRAPWGVKIHIGGQV